MPSPTDTTADVPDRRAWLALLALSDVDDLETVWRDLPMRPAFDYLRRPEIGLTMVKRRTGGSGAAFNLGEMTVTRCVVTCRDSDTGERIDGVGYVAGRDRRHAEVVARLDAAFQDTGLGAACRQTALDTLGTIHRQALAAEAAKAAATKVEFFTMERGHG